MDIMYVDRQVDTGTFYHFPARPETANGVPSQDCQTLLGVRTDADGRRPGYRFDMDELLKAKDMLLGI